MAGKQASRGLITCQARLQASPALLLSGLLDITATLHEGTNLKSCKAQRMSCLYLQVEVRCSLCGVQSTKAHMSNSDYNLQCCSLCLHVHAKHSSERACYDALGSAMVPGEGTVEGRVLAVDSHLLDSPAADSLAAGGTVLQQQGRCKVILHPHLRRQEKF